MISERKVVSCKLLVKDMTLSPHIKKYAPILIGVALALVIVPQVFPLNHAVAQNDGGTLAGKMIACTATGPINPVTCGLYFGSLLFTFLGAVGVMFGAVIMRIGLTVGFHILEFPTVQVGYSIALALANLGFVLGIIVIAIATILRIESYGMKQILWKLMMMAILVNFGLAIAGTIINFSDRFTLYFLNGATGTTSAGITDQAVASVRFTNTLMWAFQPQGLFRPPPSGSESTLGSAARWLKNFATSFISTNTGMDWFNGAIMSMLFIALFSMLIATVFISVGVLFLVRAVYLIFLLVLLPLAWLSWIFPAFKSNWDKWWHTFLRYAFFTPLSLLFLYLAVLTVQGREKYLENLTFPPLPEGTTAAEGGLVGTIGNSATVKLMLEELVLLGLAWGGIFAANAVSVTGAGFAISTAKSIGKNVGGWAAGKAWRGTKLGAGAAFGKGARFDAETLRANALKERGVKRYGLGLLARGATRLATAGGEDLVKEEKKKRANYTTDDLKAARLTALSKASQIATDQLLSERESRDAIPNDEALSEENKKDWASYGQAKAFEDMIEKKGGINVAMHTAMEAAKISGNWEEVRNQAALFMGTLNAAEISKTQLNDLFGGKDGAFGLSADNLREMAKAFAHGVAVANPKLVPTMLRGMRGRAEDNFDEHYKAAIEKMPDTSGEEKKRKSAVANMYKKAREHSAIGIATETSGSPTPAPTPPPASP